jgi:hypothetical protein
MNGKWQRWWFPLFCCIGLRNPARHLLFSMTPVALCA